MPDLFRNPAVRLVAAHVLACYVWVGAIALYSVLTRPEPIPTAEPGFRDADGDGFDDADEPDEGPWHLRGPVIAISAPVSVPCLLVVVVFLTAGGLLERLPVSSCLILLSLYCRATRAELRAASLAPAAAGLVRRGRWSNGSRNSTRGSADTGPSRTRSMTAGRASTPAGANERPSRHQSPDPVEQFIRAFRTPRNPAENQSYTSLRFAMVMTTTVSAWS